MNSTTRVPWCRWTTPWCAVSRFSNRRTRGSSRTAVWTPAGRLRRLGVRTTKTKRSESPNKRRRSFRILRHLSIPLENNKKKTQNKPQKNKKSIMAIFLSCRMSFTIHQFTTITLEKEMKRKPTTLHYHSLPSYSFLTPRPCKSGVIVAIIDARRKKKKNLPRSLNLRIDWIAEFHKVTKKTRRKKYNRSANIYKLAHELRKFFKPKMACAVYTRSCMSDRDTRILSSFGNCSQNARVEETDDTKRNPTNDTEATME